MSAQRKDDDSPWTDTSGKQSPSQPGPTNDNPNEDATDEGTHGDAPAPSSGNVDGGGTPDSSGAPAGSTGTL